MKKLFGLSILFIVAFMVFLVALMPASIALQLASTYLPKQLQIGEVGGTIWQGNASAVRYQQHTFKKVNWDITPLGLLTGSVKGEFKLGAVREFDAPYGKGSFTYGLTDNALALDNTQLRAQAESVIAALNLPMPLKTKGQIQLNLASAATGEPYCDVLTGSIRTNNISVQGLQGWIDIEQINGKLSCKSGAVALSVTEKNPLGLQLEAEMGKGGAKVSGFVKPDATMPKQVHDAVKFLGRPDQSGRYPLRF